MIINRITNELYQSRLEAKLELGSAQFNRLFKQKILYYVNNIPCADYGLQANTNIKGSRTICQ